jgi:hypothetical protein
MDEVLERPVRPAASTASPAPGGVGLSSRMSCTSTSGDVMLRYMSPAGQEHTGAPQHV